MRPASWTCAPYSPSIHRIYLTYCLKYLWYGLDHQNLTLFTDPWNEVEDKWKLSDVTRTLQGMHIPNIVIILLIIRENLTLQKNQLFFQVVTEPWKWGQGHWTCDWRKLRYMRHPYTKYEASMSSTFLNIKLLRS